MKTRLIVITLLLLILAVLLTRNDDRISNAILGAINPIKQKYKQFANGIKEKRDSYFFKKDSVDKLISENRLLRQKLLEQDHYIDQIKDIYQALPSLSKLPLHTTAITQTISYVKLNSFSKIILTKPKNIDAKKSYGLLQDGVVAGTAMMHNNQLYGFLTSDTMCRFSVFVGEHKAPGIAIGQREHEMIVKFIPKWHKIQKGDKVVTSGLDNIFFRNIPVGVVTKVELQSSYKVAYIKTYNDIDHPNTFFLVQDASAALMEDYDANSTDIGTEYSHQNTLHPSNNSELPQYQDSNTTQDIISSIPSRIDQTQEEVFEPEIPTESIEKPKPKSKPKSKHLKKQRTRRAIKSKPKNHPKPKRSTIDLF